MRCRLVHSLKHKQALDILNRLTYLPCQHHWQICSLEGSASVELKPESSSSLMLRPELLIIRLSNIEAPDAVLKVEPISGLDIFKCPLNVLTLFFVFSMLIIGFKELSSISPNDPTSLSLSLLAL